MTDNEHLENRQFKFIYYNNKKPTFNVNKEILLSVSVTVLNNKFINCLVKMLSKSASLPAKVSSMILELAWLNLLEETDLWTGDLGLLQVLLFMSNSL